MPRAKKAGPANNNRTDLAIPKPEIAPLGQPNRVAPNIADGLPYGDRQKLLQMQQAVPLRNPTPASGAMPPQQIGQPPPPPPGIGAGAGPMGSGADPMAQAIEAAQGMPSTSQGLLNAPTARPNEPVTAGLPGGNGAGTPTMPGAGLPTAQTVASSTLSNLASLPNASPDLKALASYARQASQ